jgi:hypothetical protein
MLVDGANKTGQKYNVVVNGSVKRFNVPKSVAEHYIISLDEHAQAHAKLVPVTDEGKEILLG